MSVVWCNGAFVNHLSLDPAERGLMLGDGLFETVASREGKPIWLADHFSRMQNSALELGIEFDRLKIEKAVAEVLQKSKAPFEVLRITLTRGPTARGFSAPATKPTLVLSLNPFDRGNLPKQVRLVTSSICRNQTAPSCRMKTLSYVDGIMAAREVSHVADDALMLNTSGYVASTTIANIFALKGDRLLTPQNDQGILQGIARQKLLDGAKSLGLKLGVQQLKPADLADADCVFLTNSLRFATSVLSIDGKLCETRDIDFIHSYYDQISKGD